MRAILIRILMPILLSLPKTEFWRAKVKRIVFELFKPDILKMLNIYFISDGSLLRKRVAEQLLSEGWTNSRINFIESLCIGYGLIEPSNANIS